MNREIPRPGPSKSTTERERRRLQAAGGPGALDDEFNDFFDKGDIGDYEGGVAYSQPPSKLVEAPAETAPARADFAQLRERRAFFARVVGVVVTGCVLLLITAARFKPHAKAMVAGLGDPSPAFHQPVSPAAAAPQVIPPVIPIAQKAVPAPAETEPKQAEPEPKRIEEPVVAAPRPEVAATPETAPPAAPAPVVAAPAKLEKSVLVVAKQEKTTKPQTQSVAPARTTKLASNRARRASETLLPEVKQPLAAAPVAPKQSIAAFPVD